MTDKERILSVIVSRVIPGIAYGLSGEKDRYIQFHPDKLNRGDLVFANTTIYPNDFMVGFVHEVKEECVVIRKIGNEKLCNYYNESFTKINKERLGYEILEGLQYKIYRKVLKAFTDYTDYFTRFKSISFDGNKCIVQARKAFENDLTFETSFEFRKKTTIAEIGKVLSVAEERWRSNKNEES